MDSSAADAFAFAPAAPAFPSQVAASPAPLPEPPAAFALQPAPAPWADQNAFAPQPAPVPVSAPPVQPAKPAAPQVMTAGGRIQVYCPSCGAGNAVVNRACIVCGKKLPAVS
jgi:hypothetical protein